MKLLFLACLSPKTGNHTTAERIRFAVAFTSKMKEEAEFFLLSQSSKIYVQPQGIQTEVEEKFCWAEFLRSSGVSTEHVDELRVFLLVCGLRRVKDPLYLVEVFSEWHCENPLNVLVIIGPKSSLASLRKTELLTVGVSLMCRPSLRLILHLLLKWELLFKAGVFLAQERSQQELHAAVKRCFAVVNSSVSEGMSAAILEAMDLGVPVLARDIPGNAAVVQHEFTGLLYSSPQEFVHQSQRLVADHELRERVVRNGKLYVEEHHSLKQERETYQRLVDTLL
ncbi:glycosyltransferase 1 domain-containing protein 1 isoform X4 [Dicentrarchus labrax]|uniref:glycosyltransferase 1 domain-containing protein 1 isoform X4 n=1 Tax=Dicentrarchus labrax TaxID=13489 RepID=UPI0021F5D642|nr:glycosyltransferase 1 domain-containing protein 1 isoform X4 [Dicentrarchus labrax]